MKFRIFAVLIVVIFVLSVVSAFAATAKAAVKAPAKTSAAKVKADSHAKPPNVVCEDGVCKIVEPSAAKTKTPVKIKSAICPVMGNKIANVAKAAGKSVYKGKTYYFCCKTCKPKFDKNPAKYLKKK